jgi:peptidoglycan/xylan/chitin deacetylase (PgdA/CDA1 family)
MRATFVASLLLVSVIQGGTATAGDCPPDALGVARTIVVDPREHPRIGAFQYLETLPLNDKEVVLTFDDGPVPRHTSTVLETLASECTKATFFMVGQMANAYPAMVRRVHDEGHTIANHSQTHPFTFSRMSVEQAAAQIQGGFASLRAALGDPDAVSPFFRIPGLLRQDSVEQYLAAHGVMTWSVDAVADDWTHINAAEIARRAISRLEVRGRGVLLLHDIHEKTALAFPVILKELKARGFKIVHVVPATPDRPKTVTAPEQWAAHTTPPQKLWPGVADIDMATLPAPALPVPGLESFGLADPPGRRVDVAWARSFPRPLLRAGHLPAPISPWPSLIPPAPVEAAGLAVPAAENFQYAHLFALPRTAGAGAAVRKRTASAGPVRPKVRTQPVARGINPFGGWTGTRSASPPRLFGHQL